ncbi:MAG: fumarylacetoacetate hydrolase family protein [Alphaproteobacteria bacterium]|jgi:2-keto-4-pentenoate hydratase|nr:sulfate adenylyltransferase [Rhodospirillaceae bacterium]MBT6202767.1 sulfate adenylyltransferase [Rhodospirillaceae bacterium]MBT6512903.1 sulfate adenylyltransferase [Rhodospirillaceae bacterium]MBT7647307.1 sulfate adenylyltransferase [Rhodospirillaceae bacterium]MDG2479461.1 fumarylacetoacetate hydrolase family protein [Alphaproteobacteria bacterium]
MTPDALSKAAAIMIAARDAGGEFGRLPEDVRPITAEDGYAIQDEVIRQRAASGQALAGWKIGCTVKVMQEMLGLDGPSSGAVLALNTLNTPARIAAAGLTNPVAECEIAVRMASDVPSRKGGHNQESIAEHVGACMVSIELAELRLPQRESMAVGELIADDFFQKAIVLGREVQDWRSLDLTGARATTTVSGQYMGEGFGRDIMGHPFAALAWLADSLAARGEQLRAGEVVLTGSVVKAAPIAAGDTTNCAIECLGEVSLTLD